MREIRGAVRAWAAAMGVVSCCCAAAPPARATPPASARPRADLKVTRAGAATAAPTADAGDDLIGLVGRKITLNGEGSSPADGLDYRWIQAEGPRVEGLAVAGPFSWFVPRAPGRYRFALVVARDNRISAPDFVEVIVGAMPPEAPGRPAAAAGPGAPGVAAPMLSASAVPPAAASGVDAVVAAALGSLDDAPALAGPLAETFEASALRMDLYPTYGDLHSELSRRLDAIIPPDPIRRARWNGAFFEPLTAQFVAAMLPLGLDLRSPAGRAAPLTEPQKRELQAQFDRVARRIGPDRIAR